MKPEIVSGPKRNSFHGIEAASQSFKFGDFVKLVSGKFTICATGDVALFGIAQADATGTTDAACVVTPIFPGDKVAIDTYESTPGADKDVTAFLDGVAYGMIVVSAEFYADFDDTTLDIFIFEEDQGSLLDQLGGNTSYRGVFRVIDTACQIHVGTAP